MQALARVDAERRSHLKTELLAIAKEAAAEAVKAAKAALDAGDKGSTAASALHPQCVKDFDRAEFDLGGGRIFMPGAAAREGKVKERQDEFAVAIVEISAGSLALAYIVSGLASQTSMAALGMACYSGPLTYSVPSGATLPRYRLRRRDERRVELLLERISDGFQQICTPGGEPMDCGKGCTIRHTATVLIEHGPVNGFAKESEKCLDALDIKIAEASEKVRIVHPNGTVVVNGGLHLDFRSPGPGCFEATLTMLFEVVSFPLRCLLGLAAGAANMAARAIFPSSPTAIEKAK